MSVNVREQPKAGRERPEKILVAMYSLTDGETKPQFLERARAAVEALA